MELKGKKMNFIGDSITVGHTLENQEADVFWGVLGRETGAIVRGYGIGGTRIAKQLNETGDPIWHRYFGSRVDEMDADADVIVVFGGTNDYGHGDAPLGDMSDRTDETFYGAMHNLCLALIRRYPSATVVIATPTHRVDENRLVNDIGIRNVASLSRYVQAEREVAEYYGLPVLDLYREVSINPEVAEMRERYMPDGVHPNKQGHRLIADRMIAFFKAL